ncbi:NAD(P)-dependent dehydrogenase (short-subunit alcohol dehydrogenase family) [Bradyrhizobium centrosematis]|nr:NAD(P)-dependent dehydrogenase (short-subunit alcohol dehydrogenase family) [Bradyrhizobium centrosematis]MCS3778248.1 NAD(P)-dependent dehydrogenase (short-subunit alcohol dehydrogenase family) [Bradyrhizobium centrosematis]
MTEALAVEWAKFNINVNAIAPGSFSSEMMSGMLQRTGDIMKGFPRPRIGDPAQLHLIIPGFAVIGFCDRHLRAGRRCSDGQVTRP